MKWMEPFLRDGEMAGKIVCPNKKCGAKLGNYDWAGARCSCKAWVVPVSAAFATSPFLDFFYDLGRASVSIVRRSMKWWFEIDDILHASGAYTAVTRISL
jgi:hypothetical protein